MMRLVSCEICKEKIKIKVRKGAKVFRHCSTAQPIPNEFLIAKKVMAEKLLVENNSETDIKINKINLKPEADKLLKLEKQTPSVVYECGNCKRELATRETVCPFCDCEFKDAIL